MYEISDGTQKEEFYRESHRLMGVHYDPWPIFSWRVSRKVS